jgi:hypothetical protein
MQLTHSYGDALLDELGRLFEALVTLHTSIQGSNQATGRTREIQIAANMASGVHVEDILSHLKG